MARDADEHTASRAVADLQKEGALVLFMGRGVFVAPCEPRQGGEQ